jgi:hypothetical protein
MELSNYIQSLPLEIQEKIYFLSFEGSANRIFKEFIEENTLFQNNVYIQTFKPNPHYTLYQFLCDMKIIKKFGAGWWVESDRYDVQEFVEFIMENNAGGYIEINVSSDSENDSDSDDNNI